MSYFSEEQYAKLYKVVGEANMEGLMGDKDARSSLAQWIVQGAPMVSEEVPELNHELGLNAMAVLYSDEEIQKQLWDWLFEVLAIVGDVEEPEEETVEEKKRRLLAGIPEKTVIPVSERPMLIGDTLRANKGEWFTYQELGSMTGLTHDQVRHSMKRFMGIKSFTKAKSGNKVIVCWNG